MAQQSMLTYYKQCDLSDSPLVVLPTKLTPEGFLAGHRIEKQLPNERWQVLGFQGKDKPCSTQLRLGTGELVHTINRPTQLAEQPAGEEGLPPGIKDRSQDKFVRVEPLPAGWYRIGGMEITREELRGLLPLLQPDWEGVLYETGTAGCFSFWEVNSQQGNWARYQLEREVVATADEAGYSHLLTAAGPHTLYRVHYLDPMRPGALPGLSHQHSFCLGYDRLGGPEMLFPVDLINLRAYWPEEHLRGMLSAAELEHISLAPPSKSHAKRANRTARRKVTT